MNKCLSIVTASALMSFSTASFAGLTFKMVTSENGKTTNEMQVWVDGSSMKSQLTSAEEDNPFMPPGSYMLMTEESTFLVNPEARTFARFDMSMLEGMAQVVTDSGAADVIEITNVSVEKTLDEAGESIEGYATRHYQFKSTWTMGMAGAPMTTDFSTVEDFWTTEEIALPGNASMVFDQSTLPASVKELADAQGLKEVTGFPLRIVTQQTSKANAGMGGVGGRMMQRMMNRGMAAVGADDSTTTIEAIGLEEIDIPPDTFVVPADYAETQLFPTGPDVTNPSNVPDGPATRLPEVPNPDNVR